MCTFSALADPQCSKGKHVRLLPSWFDFDWPPQACRPSAPHGPDSFKIMFQHYHFL